MVGWFGCEVCDVVRGGDDACEYFISRAARLRKRTFTRQHFNVQERSSIQFLLGRVLVDCGVNVGERRVYPVVHVGHGDIFA
jgi:hypothetical protein